MIHVPLAGSTGELTHGFPRSTSLDLGSTANSSGGVMVIPAPSPTLTTAKSHRNTALSQTLVTGTAFMGMMQKNSRVRNQGKRHGSCRGRDHRRRVRENR